MAVGAVVGVERVAGVERAEHVVHAGRQLRRGQDAQPRGGQFQGQRQAVEGGGDPVEVADLLPLRGTPTAGGGGPVQQQFDGLARLARAAWAHGQRRDAPDHLARQPDRLPAGGQYRRGTVAAEQAGHHIGGGSRVRVTGVQHEQVPVSGGVVGEGVDDGAAGFGAQAQGGRDRDVHERRVGDAGQVGEPDAVRVLVHEFAGHLYRQPGLARATGADDGDQAVRGQQAGQRLAFGRPADEGFVNRRDAEAIADERAVWLLERAGYAPTAMGSAIPLRLFLVVAVRCLVTESASSSVL